MPYHDRDQVDEVLGDLERKRVPFFVTPGVATPQDPVFAYVLEKYRQTDTFGGLRLYERNDR